MNAIGPRTLCESFVPEVEPMKYYVNDEAKEGGVHIVHSEKCQFLPNEDKRHALGDYTSCDTAMKHARERHSRVNGCQTCCPDCHD